MGDGGYIMGDLVITWVLISYHKEDGGFRGIFDRNMTFFNPF